MMCVVVVGGVTLGLELWTQHLIKKLAPEEPANVNNNTPN